MEVNSSPGMEGIEGCTGLDIAGSIIDYIANQVDFPEIDIRQRLTVSVGYGVAEIYIPEGSDFVGKTIEASGLRERDLTVLTVNRGTAVFSNPKGSRILEGGDRLLCYGKLETMRDLVPERTKRRKKPRIGKLDQSMVEALEISK
jgi:ribosomal protein S6--L-glutamate ligase